MSRTLKLVFVSVGCLAVFATGCSRRLVKLDLVPGTGETANTGDVVEVHYVVFLATGREIENSRTRGQSITFRLGDGTQLKGWDQGIPGMKVGGKRKLILPPELAYGDKRQGNDIPVNAELIFEVELVKIYPKRPAGFTDSNLGGLLPNLDAKDRPQLKIEDVKKGTGDVAKAGDRIEVHYTGWLDTGAKFESSRDADKPFEFVVGAGRVIKGWDQGVVGMKVGGVRKLIIPPELAYGAPGSPPNIPPQTTLTFEVELLSILNPGARAIAKPKRTSALKSEDLMEGTGAAVATGDAVQVHYTGWLKDGTKFDSSLDRNKPLAFTVGRHQVIEGWDQGLVGMKVGGKRKLTIPPELAYKKKGFPPAIPPNATLIFEIELLRIDN